MLLPLFFFFFFFNDTATTEIYTLSLHDALPISAGIAQLVERELPKLEVAGSNPVARSILATASARQCGSSATSGAPRSEEHTSELQSLAYLVCRLLLEKKKKKSIKQI